MVTDDDDDDDVDDDDIVNNGITVLYYICNVDADDDVDCDEDRYGDDDDLCYNYASLQSACTALVIYHLL